MYIASNCFTLNGYRIVRRIIIKEITVNATISIFEYSLRLVGFIFDTLCLALVDLSSIRGHMSIRHITTAQIINACDDVMLWNFSIVALFCRSPFESSYSVYQGRCAVYTSSMT